MNLNRFSRKCFTDSDIEQSYDEQSNELSGFWRRRFDWRYSFAFFSNSCKCFLFIDSMFFLIFRNHFLDHLWSWDFFFERFCWKSNSKDLSCWECYRKIYRFRRDRFRFFINHFIKWNCDCESQRRRKSSEWANFFCEKKFKWRRTTTFWCCFVVVVVWRFEIKRSKKSWFFCWFFCFDHWTESNDAHSNLMRILHSMCKIDCSLCSHREQHQLQMMRESKKCVCFDR